MTYNTPILMNVDTAFNVVLGTNLVINKDHNSERNCETTPSTTGSSDNDC